MSDGELLLRGILREPECDAARLVYADWLDENGEGERAEFVRVQCELARMGPVTKPVVAGPIMAEDFEVVTEAFREWDRKKSLNKRETNLLRSDWSNADAWFVGERFKLHNIYGGPTLTLTAADAPENSGDRIRFIISRGFVSRVELPCALLLEHAAAIFRAHPVLSVRLDLIPDDDATTVQSWSWWELTEGAVSPSLSYVPKAIFDLMPCEMSYDAGEWRKTYFRQEAAHESLSVACVAYGRHRAGLSPLRSAASAPLTP